MDGELVGDSSSSDEGRDEQVAPLKSYKETFEEMFPYYLSIGMTEEQYWDGDAHLVFYYRKADELKMERQSYESWLQARYFYDALCCVSPVLQAFAKKGTKVIPFNETPYPVTKTYAEKSKADKEKAEFEKNKAMMENFMLTFNKRYEKGGK